MHDTVTREINCA